MIKSLKSTFISIAVCAVALLSQSATIAHAAPQTPLVRIGETTTAPVIDGKLDDAAWKNSVAISDFSHIGGNVPATESTQVRFVYDARNLYVSWRAQESLLVIARQEMYKVKTNAQKLDDNVLSDDSVALFLQPGTNAKMHEFDLNSIGTLFDAQSDKSNLWGSRNATWNSNAHAAAQQEDGFWTAEIAIPWSAFGLNNAPAADTSWALGLARNAVGRGEISSWNPIGTTGVHSMTDFGELVFDNAVPAIAAPSSPQFEGGKSTFMVQSSAPVQINAAITSDGKTQNLNTSGTGDLKIPLATDAAKVLFAWNAQAGQKYFYRSPQLELSAESSLAHLQISTAKAWKLYVNGEQFSAGNSAVNQNIAIPLAAGVNDIVVEAQSGSAKLQLTPPLFALQENIAWKMHAADAKVLSGVDRTSWEIAPSINDEIGKTGAPIYLQHTLLYQDTLAYPVTSPALYIAQNTAQQLTFLAKGVKDIPLNNWQVTVAVPSEVEILGSSGYYGNVIKGKTRFETTKIGTAQIDGGKMTLYRVNATSPIKFGSYSQDVLRSFEILMQLSKAAKFDANWRGNLYYWTSANQNTLSEAPQQIALRALPPLNGKQPKKFVWELWGSQARLPQYDNAQILPSILQTAKDAGINTYLSSSNANFSDEVRRYDMKAFSLIGFSDSNLTKVIRPYLKEHPEEALIDKNGQRSNIYMDTSLVLGKNWPMYKKWIQDFVKSSGLDIIDYDYEYPPFNPPHASFAEPSLNDFRTFAKIDANVKLDGAIIQKDYKNQWIDFMAYRTAVLLKKMKDAVHEANPKVLFTSYSGYYDAKNDTTKVRYGIDWNLVGEMQSVDEAGMGYGRPIPGITDSVQALRGIPVKFGELLTPYDLHSRQPVAPLLKANLLRRALDSTAGVLLYTRNSMDGRSWQSIAEVSRLTADYESTFLQKTLENIPGQNAANVQIVKGDGKVLLCVMNFSRVKKSTFEIEIPQNLGAGQEYYSGETVRGGEKVEITLTPGDVKVFVF